MVSAHTLGGSRSHNWIVGSLKLQGVRECAQGPGSCCEQAGAETSRLPHPLVPIRVGAPLVGSLPATKSFSSVLLMPWIKSWRNIAAWGGQFLCTSLTLSNLPATKKADFQLMFLTARALRQSLITLFYFHFYICFQFQYMAVHASFLKIFVCYLFFVIEPRAFALTCIPSTFLNFPLRQCLAKLTSLCE